MTNKVLKENKQDIIGQIDKLFRLFDEDTNTILIGKKFGRDGNNYQGLTEEMFASTDFPEELFDKSENTRNLWCNTQGMLEDEMKEDIKGFINYMKRIDPKHKGLSLVEKVFDEFDEDKINEYWAGFIAVTRDYKFIKFICQDKDYASMYDEKGPEILIDFANI